MLSYSPSHSPDGFVRKTVKSSVNVAAKAASAHTHASHPTERSAVRVGPPRPSRSSSIAKNVKATKPVMYIVSLVAKPDRKSTRLNSSHANISYAVFCLKKNILPESH